MPLTEQGHPQPEELAQYNLGKLGDEETAAIEDHVARCEECARTVVGMPGDTFFELLRRSEAPGTQATEFREPANRDASSPPAAHDQHTLPHGSATKLSDEAVRRVLELPAELRQHSRYQIQECLGVGGMGSVYKAQHRIMNRPVALKVINPQLLNHSGAAERFRREVQAAARLSHANIVTAHDADQAGGLHFLVMEFVDGVDLHQVIQKRGPLPVHEACDYIRQAALGLQHAHQQGMVHRDIKPHNLMLVSKGSGSPASVVKILDFGLANFAGDMAAEEFSDSGDTRPVSAQLTMLGSMMGTPDYIAPEQAGDAHSVDIRADIYSLGCTLYCLLSGKAPFHEGTVFEKIRAHSEREAPPLSAIRPEVPAQVEAIVQKMMAKTPAERFQSPAEVAEALNRVCSDIAKPIRPTRKRNRPLMVALGLGSLAVMLAGVILLMTNHGTLEIVTAVDDVDVVVTQGGKEIVLKDLTTGSTLKRLDGGAWDIKLAGNRNDVRLDKSTFTLSRLGKAVVTVTRKDTAAEPPASSAGAAVSAIAFDRKFSGHTGAVKSAAFSPDGKLIASASGFPKSDGTIRLWDVATGKEVRQFKGQSGQTQSLCFSHDGHRLLAGGSDKKLRLWDVATGELLKTLEGHEGGIECVGFSPDDKIAVSGSVATGGVDHTARSWDLVTGKEIARFTGHKLHVHGVAVIDENRAISVDRMGVGYTWRIDNGQLLKRLSVPSKVSNSAYSLALSPDRSQAIIGYQDDAVRIWDVESGRILQTFATKNSPVMSVCMTADKRYVIAGGGAMGDTKIAAEVFEVAGGKRVAATEPMEGTTWSIALAPNGRHVLSAGGATWKAEDGFVPNGDNDLYLWTLPEILWPEIDVAMPRIAKMPGHKGSIGGLAWHPDGKRALSYSGAEGVALLRTIANGVTEWTMRTGTGGEESGAVAIAADGELIAIGDPHGSIHLLNKEGKPQAKWKSCDSAIASLAFSPDGAWLAAVGTKKGPAKVWEVATRKLISTRDDGPDAHAVAFTADGMFMLTGGGSFMTRRIDVDSKGVKGFASTGSGGDVPVYSVAATQDGALAAYGGADGSIILRQRTGSVETRNMSYFSVNNWTMKQLHQGPVLRRPHSADRQQYRR